MCIYQECTECDIKYEVCSEHPIHINRTAERHICHAVYVVDTKMGNFTTSRQCFDDPHSNCSKECIPDLHSALNHNEALYDCCCTNKNLCNNITFNFTGMQYRVYFYL